MIVYLNGAYVEHAAAQISVDDRGFLFADGVYEVIRLYNGRPFMMAEHIERLHAGLSALQIDAAPVDELGSVIERLLRENAVDGAGTIYIQVTRGAAPRKHAFPANTQPTVYVVARPYTNNPPEYFSAGVAAITVPDTRWSRCDIKSIALLPNVLANQAAHAEGAFEALFVRDGVVIEGSHSNLFGVIRGELRTYPQSNYILSGITRTLVLNLARELGVPTQEKPILWEEFHSADELFLSGTTTEVMPLVTVDGRTVGTGKPGPVTRRLQEAYQELTGVQASLATSST